MGLTRALVGGGVFLATAIGLAFNSEAQPPQGRYTATVIDDPSGQPAKSNTATLLFRPCGRGCTHVSAPGGDVELHLKGNIWTGSAQSLNGETCTHTVDAHLVWIHECTGPEIRAQLTMSG